MENKEYKIIVTLDDQALKDSVDKGKEAVKGLGDEVEKQGKRSSVAWGAFIGTLAGGLVLKGLAIASAGLRKVGAEMNKAISESKEKEASLNDLNTALALTGKYSQAASADIDKFSNTLAGASNFDDTELKKIAAKIQVLGKVSVEQLKQATQGAADIAAATGKPIEKIALQIGQALSGQGDALKKFGVVIESTGNKALDVQKTLDKISNSFGGAALSKTMTYEGAVTRISKSWGDMLAVMGNFITKNPAIITSLGMITKVFNRISDVIDENKDTVKDLVTNGFSVLIKGAAAVAKSLVMMGSTWQVIKNIGNVFIEMAKNAYDSASLLWNFTSEYKAQVDQRIEDRHRETIADNQANLKRAIVFTQIADEIAKGEEEIQKNIRKKRTETTDFLKDLNDKSLEDQVVSNKDFLDEQSSYYEWLVEGQEKWYEYITDVRGRDYADAEQAKVDQLMLEEKYGEAMTLIKQDRIEADKSNILSMKYWESLQRKTGMQDVKSTLGDLSALQNSQNKKMFKIGQAAASANSAIATAEGAIKAYSSLSGIPFVGPVLGAAAAAALILYGVEQQKTIWSQPPPVGAETGGAIGGMNIPTSGDKGWVRVNRLERVLTPGQNRAFEEMIYGNGSVGSNNSTNRILLQLLKSLQVDPNVYFDSQKVNDTLVREQSRRLV